MKVHSIPDASQAVQGGVSEQRILRILHESQALLANLWRAVGGFLGGRLGGEVEADGGGVMASRRLGWIARQKSQLRDRLWNTGRNFKGSK